MCCAPPRFPALARRPLWHAAQSSASNSPAGCRVGTAPWRGLWSKWVLSSLPPSPDCCPPSAAPPCEALWQEARLCTLWAYFTPVLAFLAFLAEGPWRPQRPASPGCSGSHNGAPPRHKLYNKIDKSSWKKTGGFACRQDMERMAKRLGGPFLAYSLSLRTPYRNS